MTRRAAAILILAAAIVTLAVFFSKTIYGVYERTALECSPLTSDMTNIVNISVEHCDIRIAQYEQIISFMLTEPEAGYIRVRDAATGEMLLERRVAYFHWSRGTPYLRPGELVWGMGEEDYGAPWPPSWWTRFAAKLP